MSQTLAPPRIVIGRDDYETLSNLADIATSDLQKAARFLQQELQRARVVAPEKLSADIVRIGSFVRYRLGQAPERTVQLVLPYMADIAEGRISVMTPVGAALIGLGHGQAISFAATDGRPQVLQVVEVLQAEKVGQP